MKRVGWLLLILLFGGCGKGSTDSKQNQAPNATFEVILNDAEDLTVHFDASGSSDPDGSVVRFTWNFGDGRSETSSDSVTSHIYQEIDEYIVQLTVTDDEGAESSIQKEVAVIEFRLGKYALIKRIKEAGGPYGMLMMFDHVERDGTLGARSRLLNDILLDEGVPAENIAFPPNLNHSRAIEEFLTSDRYAGLLINTPVVGLPGYVPIKGPIEYKLIERYNCIWVIPAGDVSPLSRDNRDLWSYSHPYWRPGISDISWLYYAIEAMKTGKMIVVTLAEELPDGTVVVNESSFRCGDVADHCFTVAVPRKELWQGTPGAAARLSAMVYYFSNLFYIQYSTAGGHKFYGYAPGSWIVGALKRCTRDIGEPGVDREFGHGVIDFQCEDILRPIVPR